MWELRLILILIGVVFIAAVYLLSRQGKYIRHKFRKQPPTLSDSNLPEIPSEQALSNESTHPRAEPAEKGPQTQGEQLIIALHIASRLQQGFTGVEVLAALESAGLKYGQYQVFHRLTNSETPQSVFSVANMVEPGVLNPESLPQSTIPGLTLFLLLPGPQNAIAACADMLATARLLARQLQGEVQDDKHNVLTSQAAQQIRKHILEFQQKLNG